MQPLFTVTSAHVRCVRSFFVSSSCYVTAPIAMYIKSEMVGGRGLGGTIKTGERTYICGGKLFPHFVFSNSNARDRHRDGGIFSLRIIPFVT